MFDIQPNSNPLQPKQEFYNDLLDQIKAIVEGQRNWVWPIGLSWPLQGCSNFSLFQVTNLANASAVIYHELRSLEHFQKKPLNWAGFYVVDPTNAEKLILGPFQGKVRQSEWIRDEVWLTRYEIVGMYRDSIWKGCMWCCSSYTTNTSHQRCSSVSRTHCMWLGIQLWNCRSYDIEWRK